MEGWNKILEEFNKTVENEPSGKSFIQYLKYYYNPPTKKPEVFIVCNKCTTPYTCGNDKKCFNKKEK